MASLNYIDITSWLTLWISGGDVYELILTFCEIKHHKHYCQKTFII